MTTQTLAADEQLNKLKAFRQAAYECLGAARDTQFELADAVMVTGAVNSFVELSCAPVFRRRWSSAYEALQDGRPNRVALMRLYVGQIPTTQRPVLAGDHTAWSRLSSPTLKERTIEHEPTKILGNRPITVGLGYSTLAWMPMAEASLQQDEAVTGSWALPLLVERVTSVQHPIQKGAEQLRQVCSQLPCCIPALRPISLWDSEYGCAPFVLATADIPADKVMRLRSNLCLWGAPPPYAGHYRPREHGDKFKLSDPATWRTPDETLTVEDTKLGRVEVSLWRNLHFRKAKKHPLVVVRVTRPQARDTRRDPKDLWIAWLGEKPPPLPQWWRLYLRRFAIDHWHRFTKQRQYWTLPQLGTPEQCDRWSDLMPLIIWELWLARRVVTDKPLPWQKAQVNLTPGRVCQGIGGVLAAIGTPARAPKPRGKSPGWPTGRPRTRRERFSVVTKTKKKRKKAA